MDIYIRRLKDTKIIIIGGGAAGFFAAINLAILKPKLQIEIVEKSTKLLSKVKISGGGRCNVTNFCLDNAILSANYPRGNKELRQLFSNFSVQDTMNWFQNQEVHLKIEDDGRVFPISNDSQSIIDCFLRLCEKYNIKITTQCEVFAIEPGKNNFTLKTSLGIFNANHVICCIGGHAKLGSYQFIANLGHKIISPIPSLFTFNLTKHPINKELQGISVPDAEVKVDGIKLVSRGPVLITHWGFSGPAVLKLSAFGAKELFEKDYNCSFSIKWLGGLSYSEIENLVFELQRTKHSALPYSNPLNGLPKRLWEYILTEAGIDSKKIWAEIPKKQLHQLIDLLYNHKFEMNGKTTFKEEFVTCGGVDLKEIDFKTMQSKLIPGLFFCGEVINADGITGGFNFQNAWSTAFVCSRSIAEVC